MEALNLQTVERQVSGSKWEVTIKEVAYLNSEIGPEPAEEPHVKDDDHAV